VSTMQLPCLPASKGSEGRQPVDIRWQATGQEPEAPDGPPVMGPSAGTPFPLPLVLSPVCCCR
jgi:hypothetical protein